MSVLVRLLGRRPPRSSGQLVVDGLDGPLTIRRDAWGIPHIDAGSATDAWFGLGFCHAQDRAFQLETLLRVGRGSLAALVGPNGLAADQMSRRLGFRHLAEAQLPLLDGGVRGAVEGYVRGVNAGLEHGLRRRPHEHVLLRVRPTPWEVIDVLAFSALQAFALSSNWDAELARLKILSEDGPEALTDLDPTYPDWLPVSVPVATPARASIDRLAADLAAFAAVAPSGGGSNAWAIAGARTASGKPLLANDPHLPARLPAPWYLVHLRCPDWEVAGASFVGAPALPIGHNGTAAWGITAALTDQADLFLEEIGADGVSVREGERFVPCEVRREWIEVRGGAPVEEVVLVTPRGPIVSPFLEGAPTALSLSAVWLRPLPLLGFLDSVRARDFDSFRRAFAEWPGPALNVVYADTGGAIGYQLVGQLPRRRRGFGTLPLPGWDAANGWHDELVPFEEMPFLANPPDGFVATANNPPARDGDGPFLGVDFVDGYRQARIVEALAARGNWDMAAAGELQMDVTCLPWRELRETALGLPVTDEAGRLAIELLAAWDGQVATNSAAASVYELWLADLSGRVARARAPSTWRWALGAGFGEVVPHTLLQTRSVGRLVRLLREQPDGWFQEGWPVEVADALSAAVRRLQVDHGSDPAGWAWGRLRTLTLRHPVGAQPRMAGIFNLGPVPLGGDGNTPMQAFSGPLDPLANPGFLANVRAVIDLADLDGGRWVLAGGQSGNPRSPHYRDLFDRWLRGEAVPIPWSEPAVAAATVDTLVLNPRPRAQSAM